MQIIVKDIPVFANEDEERAFWRDHDSTEYIEPKRIGLQNLPDINNIRNILWLVQLHGGVVER